MALAEMAGRADAPYWQGLSEGELRMPQCQSCREWIWPVATRCKQCGGRDIQWMRVEPRGEIYSWTRTHQPFMPQYADLVPYVTLLVALPGAGGRRLLGLFVGDESGLRIGANVEGVIAPPSPQTLDLHVLQWRLAP